MRRDGRGVMSNAIRVASAAEVPPGYAKVVEANGTRIAVFNVAGRFMPSTTRVRTRADPCPRERWTERS